SNTHRDVPVIWPTPHGNRETLLGQLHSLPAFVGEIGPESAPSIPMQAEWEEWWAARPKETRDQDGLEIVRALAYPGGHLANPMFSQSVPAWLVPVKSRAYGESQALAYPQLVHSVLSWLL